MLRIAPDLMRLQSYKSVYGYVAQFVKDPFLCTVFSFHPLLVDGYPFEVTSIYAMIHYLEREWGVVYAMGGTGAIMRALAELFRALGSKLHLNAEVEEILGGDARQVRGVRLKDGTRHLADDVVSNADVAWTYRNLLPARVRRANTNARYARPCYSISLFMIYFDIRRRYLDSPLAHHAIILGPLPKR